VPPIPTPLITDTPISSPPGTPTETPSGTVTDEPPTPTSAAIVTDEPPTPTATPGVQTLTDDELKSNLDRLSAIFLKKSRNPGLSVAVVLRDPASGQLQVM